MTAPDYWREYVVDADDTAIDRLAEDLRAFRRLGVRFTLEVRTDKANHVGGNTVYHDCDRIVLRSSYERAER